MKAYKGFNRDMTCRGYRFEEGKAYCEDNAKLCESVFHACENPIDCLVYYDVNNSVYHEVELDEVTTERKKDSKVCGKKIRIGRQINLVEMFRIAVDYVSQHIDDSKAQQVMLGDRSAASNTGNYSAASNTGDRSAASNTGNYSAASNTGDRSAASNTGYRSAASNTGNCSAASNTGDCSAAEVSGTQSVAMAIGRNSKARGALGCWIVCAEWDDYGPKDVQCAKVDGDKIKANVWYTLKDGAFAEV